MICELCGKKTDRLYDTVVEGARLSVCEECKKFGKESYSIPKKFKKIESDNEKTQDIIENIIDENYNKYLVEYREKNKLRQEDMAKLLGIKESLYKAIENKKVVPDINLAKKIEKLLGIKIINREVLSEKGGREELKVKVADIIKFEEE